MPENDNEITDLVAKTERDEDYKRRFALAVAQMVEQKVQKALGHQQSAVFQPFFQSKTVANEIRRRQTVTEQRKWTLYFEEWGCMVCETKKKGHHSLGMCSTCFNRISTRLISIIRANTLAPQDQPTFMDTVRLAREALAPSIEVLQEEKTIVRRRKE